MKLFLTVFLIFITLSLKSQNYIPFPTQNAQWNCSYSTGYYNTPNDNGTETDDESYVTAGDTVINSILYTRIEHFGTHTTYILNPNFGTYLNTYITSSGYYGCYRNDTNNRIVFFIPRDSTNEEVLYDFNVNVGDTINHWWRGKPEIYFATDNLIGSIDSVYMNGIYRKRLNITSSYMNYPVIESIGSEAGIFNPFNYFESNGSLVCFKVNGQQVYPDGPADCDVINSTPKIQTKKNVNVFPNPSTGRIYINNIESGSFISIMNILGKEVYRTSATHDYLPVDLSMYGKGIYYCKIIDRYGVIFISILSIN